MLYLSCKVCILDARKAESAAFMYILSWNAHVYEVNKQNRKFKYSFLNISESWTKLCTCVNHDF